MALAFTLASGLILYSIDPNSHSPLGGIGSAWVTVTHVGFGHVVLVSFLGRLLAAGLILFGLALFALFTATMSIALIGGHLETLGYGLRQVEQEAERIEHGEGKILNACTHSQHSCRCWPPGRMSEKHLGRVQSLPENPPTQTSFPAPDVLGDSPAPTPGGLGRFEQAEGGTLSLDDIGDMPVELQTGLLRCWVMDLGVIKRRTQCHGLGSRCK